MRLLLVLAAAACTWWLGEQLTNRREAIVTAVVLAAALLLLLPEQIISTLVAMCALLLATALFWRLMERPAPGIWVTAGYMVIMALGSRFHSGGTFVLMAHGITWIWTTVTDRRIPVRRSGHPLAALAGALALLLVLRLRVFEPLYRWPNDDLAGVVDFSGRAALAGLAALVLLMLLGTVSYLRRSPTAGLLLFLPFLVTIVMLLANGWAVDIWAFVYLAGFAALLAVRSLWAISEGTRTATTR